MDLFKSKYSNVLEWPSQSQDPNAIYNLLQKRRDKKKNVPTRSINLAEKYPKRLAAVTAVTVFLYYVDFQDQEVLFLKSEYN